MTRVAVCIPSLPERTVMCADTMTTYLAQTTEDLQVSVEAIRGHTQWGEGCNQLANSGHRLSLDPDDYLLFTCDDAVPRPGALAAAVAHHRATGQIPGCRFYQHGEPMDPSYDAAPHGQVSPWTRIFLLTRATYAQVGPLLDITWYSDIDYCQRLNEHGYTITMCDGFSFDHLDAPRSWAANGEVQRQHAVYHAACVAGKRSPLV